MGNFDPSFQETVVTSEKKLSGSKAVVLKVPSNNIGKASTSDPAPSWRTWKARQVDAEGMGTDQVKIGTATQGKTRVGVKGKEKKGSITTTNDLDIEILEIVQVGQKKCTNIGKHMGEKETMVKGKGKDKEKGKVDGGMEMGGVQVYRSNATCCTHLNREVFSLEH